MSDSIEAVLKDTYAAGVKKGALAYAEAMAKLISKESDRYRGMDGQEAVLSLARSLKEGAAVAADSAEDWL